MPKTAGIPDLPLTPTAATLFGCLPRAERISDTVSGFPTKVNMPLASSNDIILAGLTDIATALHNPLPNSPLAPLTDSHVATLHQVTTLLTGLSQPNTPSMPTPLPTNATPTLRVDDTPPLLPPPATVAPVLRVDVPTAPVALPTLPPPASTAPPLRVAASPDSETTYANSTGSTGRQRRHRFQRTQKKKRATQPTPPDGHQHHTRANKRAHFATIATTVPSPTLSQCQHLILL
jgi:hypothetical protein